MITKNQFQQNTVVYNDLLEASSKIHNWNSSDKFPVNDITNVIREELRNVIAVEHSFSGISNDRKLFDNLFDAVNARINGYFKNLRMPSFIFKSEHKAQVKNRIRSHKGIIDKSLLDGRGIQKEVSIRGDYTLFASLIELTPVHMNSLLELFMDNSTSCIISSKNNLVTDDFLESIVLDKMNHNATSSLNYLALSQLCPKGYLIHRMAGDGGDIEVDFQIFTSKENESLVVSSLM